MDSVKPAILGEHGIWLIGDYAKKEGCCEVNKSENAGDHAVDAKSGVI